MTGLTSSCPGQYKSFGLSRPIERGSSKLVRKLGEKAVGPRSERALSRPLERLGYDSSISQLTSKAGRHVGSMVAHEK
jgi:hypothetical protein